MVATAAPPRRQRRVKLKSNSSTVGEYRYDALGRRVEKSVTGATYRYIYSGVETVSVYTSTGTWKQDYVYGADIDEVVMLEQADVLDYDSDSNTSETTRSFYHANALGSVMAVTDMSQAVAVGYRYDPYGQVTITRGGSSQSSDPSGQCIRYRGKWTGVGFGILTANGLDYSLDTARAPSGPTPPPGVVYDSDYPNPEDDPSTPKGDDLTRELERSSRRGNFIPAVLPHLPGVSCLAAPEFATRRRSHVLGIDVFSWLEFANNPSLLRMIFSGDTEVFRIDPGLSGDYNVWRQVTAVVATYVGYLDTYRRTVYLGGASCPKPTAWRHVESLSLGTWSGTVSTSFGEWKGAKDAWQISMPPDDLLDDMPHSSWVPVRFWGVRQDHLTEGTGAPSGPPGWGPYHTNMAGPPVPGLRR